LHNFVRKGDGCNYYYDDFEGTVCINNHDDFQGHGRFINRNGMEVIENFAYYFINQGAVTF